MLEAPPDLAGERIELLQGLDLIAEEFHPQAVFQVGGHNVDHVAPHPEAARLELQIVALVEVLH